MNLSRLAPAGRCPPGQHGFIGSEWWIKRYTRRGFPEGMAGPGFPSGVIHALLFLFTVFGPLCNSWDVEAFLNGAITSKQRGAACILEVFDMYLMDGIRW
jgi:hypothetical protein